MTSFKLIIDNLRDKSLFIGINNYHKRKDCLFMRSMFCISGQQTGTYDCILSNIGKLNGMAVLKKFQN